MPQRSNVQIIVLDESPLVISEPEKQPVLSLVKPRVNTSFSPRWQLLHSSFTYFHCFYLFRSPKKEVWLDFFFFIL